MNLAMSLLASASTIVRRASSGGTDSETFSSSTPVTSKRPMADERVLFVDDASTIRELARHIYPGAVTCRKIETAQDLMRHNSWDLVSMDFTLDGTLFDDRWDTGGMVLSRWIADNTPDVAKFIVHSHSRPGSIKMARDILEAGYDVVWHPWGDDKAQDLEAWIADLS